MYRASVGWHVRLCARALPALACACIAACATARSLLSLGGGEASVDLSFPAVIVKSTGPAFPIGTVVIGGRVGLTRGLELSLSLQPANLIAAGLLTLETGLTWHLRPAAGWMPGVHLANRWILMTSFAHWGQGVSEALRVAATLEGTLHWEPASWLWPYLSFQGALVLANVRPLSSVFIGAQLWASSSSAIGVELGWAAFSVETRSMTQPYVGVGGRGAICLGLSYSYYVLRPAKRAAQ